MMKWSLLASLIVASAAQAQVIECPKFYPSQDTVLPEVPYQHKGKGLLRKAKLSGAAMSEGEFNGDAMSIMHGLRKETKGGWEEEFPMFRGPKWLVCYYEPGNVTWWDELGSEAGACKLKFTKQNSEGMAEAKLTCGPREM